MGWAEDMLPGRSFLPLFGSALLLEIQVHNRSRRPQILLEPGLQTGRIKIRSRSHIFEKKTTYSRLNNKRLNAHRLYKYHLMLCNRRYNWSWKYLRRHSTNHRQQYSSCSSKSHCHTPHHFHSLAQTMYILRDSNSMTTGRGLEQIAE